MLLFIIDLRRIRRFFDIRNVVSISQKIQGRRGKRWGRAEMADASMTPDKGAAGS